MKRIYQVWIEKEDGKEIILFSGSKINAYKYYNWKKNCFPELHIGYLIPERI